MAQLLLKIIGHTLHASHRALHGLRYLGMVFQWENTFYKRQHAHSYTGNPETPGVMYPDFVKIAEGYCEPPHTARPRIA